jgi:hypothetical protein
MFANEKPLNRFEVSAIISICGLLFIMAFKDLGHLSWAIPAMTLFSLAGLGFLFATLCKSERASWAIPAMTLFSLAGLGFLFATLCKSERA